jgi:prolipoprotein diacylglyceryltransferase
VLLAVITLDFDPVLRLGDLALRLETLGIAAAVFIGLLVAAAIAGSTPAEGADPGPYIKLRRLRRDDLLYVALGAVPGAVAGGRLGYALVHADYYASDPLALFDPAQGSLELAGAVVGGALTAGVVARLLDGPVGRWYHAGALPVLAAIALGKAATALGGSGQGQPFDGAWATAYVGPGPWGSVSAATPSHPAQLYESLVTGAVLLVVGALFALGTFDRRDGRGFLVAIAAWLVGRAVVAIAWRDPAVVGPLNGGQLLALALAAVLTVLAVLLPQIHSRAVRGNASADPRWPDPETRPHF